MPVYGCLNMHVQVHNVWYDTVIVSKEMSSPPSTRWLQGNWRFITPWKLPFRNDTIPWRADERWVEWVPTTISNRFVMVHKSSHLSSSHLWEAKEPLGICYKKVPTNITRSSLENKQTYHIIDINRRITRSRVDVLLTSAAKRERERKGVNSGHRQTLRI